MDTALRELELEIRQMLGWLSKAGLDDLVMKRLALCAEARQKHDWTTAIDLCWQVINQAKALDRINGNRDSIEGWGRMYLGAVYYCQGDFAQAADHFDRALSRFSLDMANQRVAQFACGAAHARRGDRTSLDRSVTPQLVSTLRTMGVKRADTLWKTLESCCNTSGAVTAVAAPGTPNLTVDEPKPLNELTRRDFQPPENDEAPRSMAEQAVMIVFLVLLVVACAFVVVGLTKTWYALIPYAALWALAGFLFVRRIKYVIPPSHALVIERSGVHHHAN